MTKTRLIKLVDNCIQNMATKGVYYPRRLKPKWDNISNPNEKIELFLKYVSNETPSIGFRSLVKVNLPVKTLEFIVIENPECCKLLNNESIYNICAEKFRKYKNGKEFLHSKGID